MKKYSVRLSFQCTEDWNQMNPSERGRHCTSCNKTVIDFTSMRDEEIVKYLLQNKNTCGRFQPEQLGRPVLISNYKPTSNWRAIATMLIAGLFSFTPSSLNASDIVHGNIDPRSTTTVTELMGNASTEVNPTKESIVVEPDKSISYYTIHLFDSNSQLVIFNGFVSIPLIGDFHAKSNGDILVENKTEWIYLPNTLVIVISAPGYATIQYNINKKDLKNSTTANLYLNQIQMPTGIVEIDEIKTPEK